MERRKFLACLLSAPFFACADTAHPVLDSNSNTALLINELYRIEPEQTRIDTYVELQKLGWFPKEWVVAHFCKS